jgi:hypothetical protein
VERRSLRKPGGLRAVVAESVLTRHQILILNRRRKRAPNVASLGLAFTAELSMGRRCA